MKIKNNFIGIGITTRNRPEVLSKTLEYIKKYSPSNAKIVIIDDASVCENEEVTFKFDKNVGIATAKNKCLELLESCEHIFLFDDDTYPIADNWYMPYIESDEPHLMYLFKDFKTREIKDSVLIYQDKKIKALSHPRGCMLYFKNSVLKVAGGMDIEYKKWGFEHGDLSNRIYNLGMTSFRFADVVGSEDLIHSCDEFQEVQTTVCFTERSKYIQETQCKYNKSFTSTQFKPYKDYDKYKESFNGKDVIITTFLNGVVDNQRNRIWEADYNLLSPLIDSCNKNKVELVILNNCFNNKDTKYIKHVKTEQGINPYFQRWLSIWQYLRSHKEIGRCFLIDSTDVEVLKNPFPEMNSNVIYSGDEKEVLSNRWLSNNTRNVIYQSFFFNNRTCTMLNCGVIGGSRVDVMKICRDIFSLYFADLKETIDMPIYNYIMYTKYFDKVEFGRNVTTIFKANERLSKAWFKHK